MTPEQLCAWDRQVSAALPRFARTLWLLWVGVWCYEQLPPEWWSIDRNGQIDWAKGARTVGLEVVVWATQSSIWVQIYRWGKGEIRNSGIYGEAEIGAATQIWVKQWGALG